VLLPCATRARASAEEPPAEPARDRQESIVATILLAEDSEAVRRVAEKVLVRFGARVIAVADGQQAVDRFGVDPGQFDLLFLDIMMPGLSGFEVAARCRSLRPDIPVLFCQRLCRRIVWGPRPKWSPTTRSCASPMIRTPCGLPCEKLVTGLGKPGQH